MKPEASRSSPFASRRKHQSKRSSLASSKQCGWVIVLAVLVALYFFAIVSSAF